MNKEKIITISVVFLVLIAAGGIIYFRNFQSSAIKDLPSEEVAKWIGEHSVLYVLPTCSHCKDQENLFGINVKYLNIVDCSNIENRQKCIDEGIINVPTWVINGQQYIGVQSIEKLKELTGYNNSD